MCHSVGHQSERFASRTGFQISTTIAFVLLTAAIICNIQVLVMEKRSNKANHKTRPENPSIVTNNGNSDLVATTQLMMSGEPQAKGKSHILIWTDDDSKGHFSLVLKKRLVYLKDNSCPMLSECIFHYDKKRHIEESEAIVIAAKRHFPYGGKATDKIWTLLLPDPDYHQAWIEHAENRHLDVKLLISYISGANEPLVKAKFRKSTRPSRGSPRLAAAIIDECQTDGNREEYLKALQEHATVHIYGRCGAPCPGEVTEDCLRYLDKHYKFFLIFESHICQDFLSPDLWRFLSTATNMIPVVFGGVNYSDFLPPEVSYIDALNHSPEVLGLTLNYLMANETAFDKYRGWRENFDLSLTEWPCTLCERLRSEQEFFHENITTQATSHGLCTSWPALDFAQQPQN